MNLIGPELTGLTSDWCGWPCYHPRAIVRRAGHLWVAVSPSRKRWAITAGRISQPGAFTDLWRYYTSADAVRAADKWTGFGEPVGWYAHPRTGRLRLPNQNIDLNDIDLLEVT